MERAKIAKAAVLFTGGKDSCLALLKTKNKYTIKYLLTILPSSYDSYMYHKPFLPLLRAQAKVLGLPLLIQKSSAQKEIELKDLEKLLMKVKGKVSYIIVGAVASTYQRSRIETVAKKLGFKVVAPLWGLNPKAIWGECIKNHFEIILTKIACEGLGKEWLGKGVTERELDELIRLSKKYGFNLEFEGGDAETAVLICPLFKKRIRIKGRIKSESQYRHFLIIEKVSL